MSEYEDGLNVACWDWRRTWVKIILSFVPLGLLFVCLTDVQPLCVCTERLLRRALWSASLLISAYLCDLSPALTDATAVARGGSPSPLHTNRAILYCERADDGAEPALLPPELRWQIQAVVGDRGEICIKHGAAMLCLDMSWQGIVQVPEDMGRKRLQAERPPSLALWLRVITGS